MPKIERQGSIIKFRERIGEIQAQTVFFLLKKSSDYVHARNAEAANYRCSSK